MSKYIIAGMMALSLLFASCSKESNEPAAVQTETKDLTYIELNVGSAESEEARVLLYNDQHSNTEFPKPKLYWGNDGDKVKVRTLVARYEGSLLKPIFNDVLEWVITRGGTRLEYKGKIAIPTAELAGVNRLFLTAFADMEENEREFLKTGFREFDGLGRINYLDMDIPMIMETELKKAPSNPNRFINDDSGSVLNKFVAYGDLLNVTIHNNLDIPITPTRARYSSSNSQLTTGFIFGVSDQSVSHQTDLLLYEASRYVPNSRTRVNYENFPAGGSIAPGDTRHYIIWYPNYTEFGGRSIKLSFEFLEQAASQALIVSASPPASFSDNTSSFPSLSISGYILNVGQP